VQAVRRITASSVVAAGALLSIVASAAPAAAINPGGGRHRVHTEQARHNSSRHSASSSEDNMSPQLKQDFYRLRMCESSDNYRDNTGNGYYGAYQFALSTWHNLGMSGRPDQAAPSMQDHAAYTLYKRDGWSPWPACSQREHLR
jgi:hypothetical protein